MSDVARDLIDRYWDYHVEVDDETPLWDSSLDEIERWPTTSSSHTDAMRERMTAFRDEALALLDEPGDGAGELTATVRTVADAAALMAARADTFVELELPHPELGLHSHLYWAVNNFALRTPEHGQRYLAKLAAFPGAVDQLRERLTEAADAGRAPLARHARRAVDKLASHLATDLADDPLLAQASPTELDDDAAAAWRDELAAAVRDSVRPALARLRDTLHDVSLPAGRDDDRAGLGNQPDGDATYAALVEGYTAPGITPDEVHRVGLAQVDRLAAEFRELGGRVFDTGELGEVFARLRDPELHHDTADQVVAAATELHARAQEVAPEWFRRTPASPCDIRATEHGSIAFYSRPAADGSRPGVFFFNTSDPTIWGPNLASTVFHEGIPGHHFQLALAVEDDGLHDLHRDLFLPAFGEGWALYTERLADEMGLFPSDLDRLGMLANDALRACRLVVDTGMHALGWSRQQAIDWMLGHSPLGEVEVTAEIDRYIGMPGQATSYMMGRLEIEQLRDDSRATLGDDFDLRAFHDVVLSHGMVSLPALRHVVEAWAGAA